MNRRQKIFLTSTILLVILAISLLAYLTPNSQVSSKLKVVTTFYPLTYITQQIGGDYIEVIQLLPNNAEVHTWEPSVSHIMAVEDADIIFYNGAGADHWIEEDILPVLLTSNNRTIVETTHNLILITNSEPEHNDEHNHGLYDPHTWVSPYMVKQQAENIYNTLISIDPQHESYYTQRWLNLKEQFEQLDTAYLNRLSNTEKDHIFVSHEAFRYLADRYSFTQQGVIGVSADQQPSISTIEKLITDMKEYQTYTLYVDPIYSSRYMQTIKNDMQTQTGQTVTVLNLYLMLGPVDGLDYLQQMQTNLVNLQTGLGAN